MSGMPTRVDRATLLQLIEDENAQIVDVLPEPEYAEAHLPRAVNIPLRELDADAVAILSKDRPVVVYCHDGL